MDLAGIDEVNTAAAMDRCSFRPNIRPAEIRGNFLNNPTGAGVPPFPNG